MKTTRRGHPLLRLVRSRAWTLGAAGALSAGSAILGLAPALLVFGIAHEVLSQAPSMERVERLALLGLGAMVIKHALMAGSTSLAHMAAFQIIYDLRIAMARKMAQVPLGFFSRRQVGQLHKAMSEDVGGLEAFLAHIWPDLIAALVAPLGALLVMAWVDWRLALSAFAVVPLALLTQRAMLTGDALQAYERHHEVTRALKQAVHEYVRGIHVIKSFGIEAKGVAALREANAQQVAFVQEYAQRSAPPMIVALKLMSGGTNALLVAPMGVWLHSRGQVDAATLVFFLVVSPQVLSPFMRIATALGQLQVLLQGALQIEAILEEPELPEGERVQVPTQETITLEDVSFGYGEGEPAAIVGVSAQIKAGQVTAIVGPSGAGKSTLIQLIARFWDPTRGRILVGDVDVRELELGAWLDQLSLVFQDVFLFEGSVIDNLRLAAPEATQAQIEQACQAACLHDELLALPQGYQTPLGDRGARLSGGQRQRLSIARALLKGSPIVILDEATAFADPEREARIQEAIAQLARGRTLIVIAHKLSTIRGADQILVMDQGRLVAQGRHDALLSSCALYASLWQAYDQVAGWTLDLPLATDAQSFDQRPTPGPTLASPGETP